MSVCVCADRESVVAAKMARELLFEKDHVLAPESYVQVSQTLVLSDSADDAVML